MIARQRHYWFPAKRYGWGWGLPVVWQGWAALALWLAALILGSRYLIPPGADAQVAYALAMGVVLLIICLKKGEPPQWRFGDKN